MAQLPSALKNLIGSLERLPGVGPKSASRLAFYILNTPNGFVEKLSQDLLKIKSDIVICEQCFGVSEDKICSICADSGRNHNLICVVEKAIDVVALESVGNYSGVYHVLGGVINPLNHVGPEDLKIEELLDRLEKLEGSVEIILATNLTMEGEATALYLKKKIGSGYKISRIGSGLPIGADMEYADRATLSRAMEGRTQI